MKTLKYMLVATFIGLLMTNCKNEANPEVKTIEVESSSMTTKKLDPNATYVKAEFTIDGMSCAVGCAATIEKKISLMEGVKSAKVDFDNKLAMVEYDNAKVTPTSLIETVAKVGDVYKVSNMKTTDAFSAKKSCDVNCAKACCASKTDAEKTACAADCTKACCSDKAKV
jgi:periplasmic mercuric ion binding protein